MGRYDATAQRSLAAIKRAGSTVTFPGTASSTPGIYDPTTGVFTEGTPGSDAVGRAVQIEGDPDRWSSLGLTLTNPVTLMLAASGLTVTPTVGASFTWAGTTYVIRDVDPVAPDGTPIIYTITGDA